MIEFLGSLAPRGPETVHETFQEEVFEGDRGRAAYVADPDGHVVELWTWDVAGAVR